MNQELPSIPQAENEPKGGKGASGMAIASLTLGIISVLCMCSCVLSVLGILLGIPAVVLGWLELKNIREGRSSEQGRSLATAGFVLGIVGTVISFIAVIGYLSTLIFGISTDIWESMRT